MMPAASVLRRRIIEMGLLFFALPIALACFRHHLHHKVMLLVIAGGLIFGTLLACDRTFDQRAFLTYAGLGRRLRAVLMLFVPLAAALAAVAWLADGRYFFLFPRERPWFWLVVMILYPSIGALLQEIIFRGWFFHRYGPLFTRPGSLIAVNAISFALFHLVYGNVFAPAMSLAGGLLFAWRYAKTGSLWTVAFEHGVWGDLLFTIGLGRFLFSGAIH